MEELHGEVGKQQIILWAFTNISEFLKLISIIIKLILVFWGTFRCIQVTTSSQQFIALVLFDLLGMIIFWKLERMSKMNRNDG